jgi:hypothetical protein
MPDMQGRALRPPEGTREGCPYRGCVHRQSSVAVRLGAR